MDEEIGAISAILLMIAIGTIIAMGILHKGDNLDDVNTEILGSIICEEKGLEYSGREFKIITHKGTPYGNVPTIYCTNKNKEEIIDGIVVKR